MSVINQMLRDLDTRQASEQERAGLPRNLRRLPPSRISRDNGWRMLALGIALGALVAGLGVGLYLKSDAPAPVVPAPAPTSAAPSAPAQPAVSAPPVAAAPSHITVVPPPPPRPADTADMKLSGALSAPPKAPAPVAPKPVEAATATPAASPAMSAPPPPAPETKAAAVEEAKPVAPKAEPREAPAKPAAGSAAGGADTQIDKRNKGGSGRDLAEAEYRKGMQAVKRGDNAAALESLKKALDMDPMLAKARQALLSVLVSGKQWEEARLVAQAGLALDPKQVGWAVILARLQFEQGEAAAAIDTMGRHAAHAENDADYQGLYAYLLQKQQHSNEAAQRFQAALKLRPNEGRWWFGLGLSLESAGRGGEAKEAYARAKQVGNLSPEMLQVVEQKLK